MHGVIYAMQGIGTDPDTHKLLIVLGIRVQHWTKTEARPLDWLSNLFAKPVGVSSTKTHSLSFFSSIIPISLLTLALKLSLSVL